MRPRGFLSRPLVPHCLLYLREIILQRHNLRFLLADPLTNKRSSFWKGYSWLVGHIVVASVFRHKNARNGDLRRSGFQEKQVMFLHLNP